MIAFTIFQDFKKIKAEKQVHHLFILGFGYGKKTDLDIGKNPEHIVPPPTTYNLNTFVDTNKLHKKGFTPRNSREV